MSPARISGVWDFCLLFCFLQIYLFMYFWLHWVLVAVFGLSLVVASRGYSLLAVLGLLTAVASLVAEHRL